MEAHITRLYRITNEQDKRLEEIETRLDNLELLQPDPDEREIELADEITDMKYPTGGPGG